MLCNLVVDNYALISGLEIEFRKGLTIVTGETGAGKSILLGALSLILGKRADTSVLLDKEKKCIVEGTFDISGCNLGPFLEENGIDPDDQTIIRREISVTGKSRAFINDTPVTLEVLSEFGRNLIDIHSQHQNLNLASSVFQMNAIDNYASCGPLLGKYREVFTAYHARMKKYRDLLENSGQMKAELDYLQFQFRQLEEARIEEGEQEALELELEKLNHAGEIKNSLSALASLLDGENNSSLQQLKECTGHIHRIYRYLPDGENLLRRFEAAYIDLKDMARDIRNLNDQHDPDPEGLTRVNDRLNLLYTLQKKHRVSSAAELVSLREQLRARIREIGSVDVSLEEYEKDLEARGKLLNELSFGLRQRRQDIIPKFEKKILDMLREVGIPNAGFKVDLGTLDDFSDRGKDSIRFQFSANRNQEPQDISRVASGGELSRLMLCIKSLLVDVSGLPTLIFDEIDTGVSGDIAERVGNIISRMAEKRQIINITHLPQVASKGEQHYLVYKSEEARASVTRVKLLSPQERLLEIAKMLSGEEITPAAVENARALLGN